MGATVVDTSLNTANWAKVKPKDYKGTDLTNAIKAYEAVTKKEVTIPASLPAPEPSSISGMTACIKELQTAVTDMQKGLAYLKELSGALQKVSGAASKTSADLKKQAKDKDGAAKREYDSAANVASGISAEAASIQRQLR